MFERIDKTKTATYMRTSLPQNDFVKDSDGIFFSRDATFLLNLKVSICQHTAPHFGLFSAAVSRRWAHMMEHQVTGTNNLNSPVISSQSFATLEPVTLSLVYEANRPCLVLLSDHTDLTAPRTVPIHHLQGSRF